MIPDTIRNDILEAYGSVSEPDYSFAYGRAEAGIYDDVITQLKGIHKNIVRVDLNYDVEIDVWLVNFWWFTGWSKFDADVYLSLVGRYALFTCRYGIVDVVEGQGMGIGGKLEVALQKYAELLRSKGFEILTKAQLGQKMKFKCPEREEETANLGQILFSQYMSD